MSAKAISSLSDFLKHKPAIQSEFEAAFKAAIELFGQDLAGVDWFSSTAEFHPSNSRREAA